MFQIEADDVDVDVQKQYRVGAPPKAIQLQCLATDLHRVWYLNAIELGCLGHKTYKHESCHRYQSVPLHKERPEPVAICHLSRHSPVSR
jgi:hypothetical protein